MAAASAQPNDFHFRDDERALWESAERFLLDRLPANKLHALVAEEASYESGARCNWDKQLWQEIVDLGWLMVAVPERAGGIGMSTTGVAGLAEQAGRAALPGPLLATLSACYILAGCETQAADTALKQIVEGESFGYAGLNSAGDQRHDKSDVELKNGVLSGTAYFVQEAQKVDHFIVKARSENGMALATVPARARGMTITPNAIIDLTRDQAKIEFTDVAIDETQIVSEDAVSVLEKVTPALLTLLTADICGAAEWQLQTTAEYARTRQQFGHYLGFFQAVKYPLVEFMVQLDSARSHLYNAACAVDFEPAKAEQYARMAISEALDAAAFGSRKSIQLHGGIGFTWECHVHLYAKRQMHNQALMGDATHHRAQLAACLLAEVTAKAA